MSKNEKYIIKQQKEKHLKKLMNLLIIYLVTKLNLMNIQLYEEIANTKLNYQQIKNIFAKKKRTKQMKNQLIPLSKFKNRKYF